jgi:glycosyltransferase involved in cell wall biosynthesis
LTTILFLPSRYFPAISGAEFYMQRIAEVFNKEYRFNVKIITSNAIDFKALRERIGKVLDESSKYYYKVNNLPVNRYPIDYDMTDDAKLDFLNNMNVNALHLSPHVLKGYLQNGPFLKQLLEDLQPLKSLNIDIIHATFYPYFNLIIALMIAKMLDKPVICTPFFHFSNPRYTKTILYEPLSRFNGLITCTQLEKDFLVRELRVPKNRVAVIPMGVDRNYFESNKSRQKVSYNFKREFFSRKERGYKMVLFCGYKNYEKGAITLLKAIPIILEKYKKVCFTFIGPPTEAFNRELRKIQKSLRVKIINLTPGNLNGYFDKRKIGAFKESDLYVMPSRSDAYGIAFLEAWAASKPVIGARIGATPEVIRDGMDGLLVPFDSPRDLSHAIIKLLSSKKLRKKLGTNGYQKVKKGYSWEVITQRTYAFYHKIIKDFEGEI